MIKNANERNTTFESFHPIVIFIYFISTITITMFSMHPIFLIMTFSISFIYSIILYGKKALKFNVGILIPIMVVTMVLNPLFTHKGSTVLFYLNGNAMTLESIIYGLAAATMLSSVIIWFSCFNRIMTSDKLIYLFGRILPVLALVLSMCLRFVPMLMKRFREISEGQKCMGRDFSKSSILKRIRQFGKEISILIAWSLEMSIETSDSMGARGYGLKGRSSFSIFRFDKRDMKLLTVILLFVGVVVAGCTKGENNILYYPQIIFNSTSVVTVVTMIAYLLLLTLPMIIDVRGELIWKSLSLKI